MSSSPQPAPQPAQQPALQPALQQRTLRYYGELLRQREYWGGKLAVAHFAGAAQSGFSAAASLAGCASLTVSDDVAAMKTAFRDGSLDFVVTTLDEAVRALKNEVRQKRAIAIGLTFAADAYADEARRRGLQADYTAEEDGGVDAPGLGEWLTQQGWRADWVEPAAASNAEPTEAARLRWMRDLPAHQRSVRGQRRWAWVETP